MQRRTDVRESQITKQEHIPKKWQDPDDKNKKVYDLTANDLPVAAVFTSYPLVSPVIQLIATDGRKNEQNGKWERVPGTGCRLVFRDFRKAIQNKKLLELLMSNDAYANGFIRPDPEDPTGFWRQMGVIKVKVVETAHFDGGAQPEFETLKLTDLKVEESVKSLHVE